MKIDQVCGRPVIQRRNAHRTEYAGQQYLFCSPACLQRFDAEPDLFTLDAGEGNLVDRDRGLRPVANPGSGQHARLEQGPCH